MSNIKEVNKTEVKNKDATKKEKSFSLFTCTKEEFNEWFDPL
jgi:sortase (surface protein transpeptidase)